MKKMQCPNKGYMFVVDVDGKHSLLRLEPMNLRLNQIQEVLGGYFQIITYNQNIGLLVDEDGLNKKVHLLNWVYGKEKKQLLNRADIFVLPSYREGMPNSLIEAMSSNTAVISTTVGGIPDLVKSGINGILVNPGEIEALKNAILYYLNDEEKMVAFAQKALDHVKKNNTIDAVIDKFNELIN